MDNEMHTPKGIVVSFDEYIHRIAIKIETISIPPPLDLSLFPLYVILPACSRPRSPLIYFPS